MRSMVQHDKPYWHTFWCFVRTSSWFYSGERSDLHDLISTIYAIIFRHLGISIAMPTLLNPVEEALSEIYARVFTFERNNLINFELNDLSNEYISSVLTGSIFAGQIMNSRFPVGQNKNKVVRGFGQSWAKKIAKFLKEDIEDLETPSLHVKELSIMEMVLQHRFWH